MRRAALLLVFTALGAGGVAGPAAAQTFIHYTCTGGTQFEAALFPGTRAAFLQIDGKSVRLPKRASVGWARYAGAGMTLRIKGERATLRRAGRTVDCRAG